MTDKEIMAYLNEFLGGIVMARTYKKRMLEMFIYCLITLEFRSG